MSSTAGSKPFSATQRLPAARAQAETVADALSKLQRVTEAALGTLALDEMLASLVERIRDVFGADLARILLRDEQDRSRLIVGAASGFESLGAGDPVPLGEALAPLLRLVALRPGYPDAAFNLGNALMAVDEPERAETAYRLAVLLEPGSVAANNNLGAAIMSQCRPEAAAVSYRRAVRLDPGSAEHHKNLGVCQLTAGNFEEGAREYEWRTRQAVWQWNRNCPGTPLWDGGQLDGKTILVHFEQGLAAKAGQPMDAETAALLGQPGPVAAGTSSPRASAAEKPH